MNLQQPTVIEATTDQQASGKAEAKPQGEGTGIAPWLAWSLWALSMALIALSLVFAYASDPSLLVATLVVNVLGVPALFAYATVGALIASRRPENPIGWVFCAAALLVAIGVFAEEYARYALLSRPGSLPGGLAMAWLTSWLQNTGFLLMFTFLLLLFPNGRLPRPGGARLWRAIAWLTAGVIALGAVFDAFRLGRVTNTLSVDNPLGIESISRMRAMLQDLVILSTIAVCLASVIVRFRGAKGDERQQLKWFAYAAVLAIAQFGVRLILPLLMPDGLPDAAYDAFLLISIAAFPIAAGVAILKYRLYDIDLLINRTLVYVPLTAILAGLYSASIALFQKLFVAMTGQQSDAAIVITTLILASSFTPIKNSLQTTVDKRFKEAPDPTKKLRAFAEQVRSFVQLSSAEQITQRLLDEVTSSFGATCGAVYLRPELGLNSRSLNSRSEEPPQEPGRFELVHACGEWDGEPHISVPLKGQGEQFGLVSLGPRRSGLDYTPQDRQTLQEIADVVAQAIEVAGRAR